MYFFTRLTSRCRTFWRSLSADTRTLAVILAGTVASILAAVILCTLAGMSPSEPYFITSTVVLGCFGMLLTAAVLLIYRIGDAKSRPVQVPSIREQFAKDWPELPNIPDPDGTPDSTRHKR